MHPTLMPDWVVAGEIVASWVCLVFQASQGYACSSITCKCFSVKGQCLAEMFKPGRSESRNKMDCNALHQPPGGHAWQVFQDTDEKTHVNSDRH